MEEHSRLDGSQAFEKKADVYTKDVSQALKRNRGWWLRGTESSYAVEIGTALKLHERVMYVVYYVWDL